MARMIKHVKKINETPQSEPAKENQIQNNAGGFVFQITKWDYLKRFLILGSEGGTYYVQEKKLTKDNMKNVISCIQEDGIRTVKIAVQISDAGRAPKNEPAILVLAACMNPEWADLKTRSYAAEEMPKICRIGTHLYQWIEYIQEFRGWGRLCKTAVQNWFISKTELDIEYQALKYQQRKGVSMRDVLRLGHPSMSFETGKAIFQYITHPEDTDGEMINIAPRPKKIKINGEWKDQTPREEKLVQLPNLIQATIKAKTSSIYELCNLIREFNLPRECIPTEALNSTEVWRALLEKMPITATIRNLGKMSKLGLLNPLTIEERLVCERITNEKLLQKGRVHPLNLLIGMRTYETGHGFRGNLEWDVNQNIVESLEDAFYKSFKFVEPTNKRFYLAIDVSGSMGTVMENSNISCCEAATAMAMTTLRTEHYTYIAGFFSRLQELPINKKSSLKAAMKETSNRNFGGTDCAAPMLDAMQRKIPVDCFIVYTDNETWDGHIHPFEALKRYRREMNINAKLIVVGMTAVQFSIADPSDPGMMDVVGFDTSVPQIINEFVR